MTISLSTLYDAKEMWIKLATEAAPLGIRAIREHMAKFAGQTGVEIIHVAVASKAKPGSFEVAVRFRNPYRLANPNNDTHHFVVDNPSNQFESYEVTKQFIAQRQTLGEPNNADEFMYGKILDLISRTTQYDVAAGDIWVHVFDTPDEARKHTPSEGLVAFGRVTTSGSIALAKYIEVAELRQATTGEV